MQSYEAHREAYIRIFDRLGFEYAIVAAMSGAMGGSASEEFLAKAENGEDTYVRCTNCDYAANVEAVRVAVPDPVAYDDVPAAHAEHTPDTPTIETLVDHLNAGVPARRPGVDRGGHAEERHRDAGQHPDGTREPLAIGVPGDRDVDLKRLGAQVEPAEVEAFDEADFAREPAPGQGLHRPGRAGRERHQRHPLPARPAGGRAAPVGHRRRPGRPPRHRPGRRPRLRRLTAPSRPPTSATATPARAAVTRSRPPAASRWATSSSSGTKYAEALDLRVLDENGKLVTVTMGSYGVGVSRAVARGRRGLPRRAAASSGRARSRRPTSTSSPPARTRRSSRPPSGSSPSSRRPASRVLYDDRPKVSPGVKFKDAELVGVPTIVVVGRGLVDGVVEVKDRASGTSDERRARRGGRAPGCRRPRVTRHRSSDVDRWRQ